MKLSEEEIIKQVESAIWFMKEDNYNVNTFVKAIQGLLDLYQQEKSELDRANAKILEEKAKNKELEHQQQVEIEGRNILVGLNENLKEELKKEKEKNKILELAKIPYLEGEIMGYKENTVSKDKIKEIIYPTPTNPISYEIQTSDMYRKILQLLEEK